MQQNSNGTLWKCWQEMFLHSFYSLFKKENVIANSWCFFHATALFYIAQKSWILAHNRLYRLKHHKSSPRVFWSHPLYEEHLTKFIQDLIICCNSWFSFSPAQICTGAIFLTALIFVNSSHIAVVWLQKSWNIMYKTRLGAFLCFWSHHCMLHQDSSNVSFLCFTGNPPPSHHIYVKICSSELKPNAHIQLAWRFTLNESVSNFILALAYCNILHRNGEALGSVSQAELQSFVMLEESPPTKPLFGTFLKTNV